MVSRSDFRLNALQILSELACFIGVVVMLFVLGRGAFNLIQNTGSEDSQNIKTGIDYIVKFWPEVIYMIVCFGFMFPLLSMVSFHLKIVRIGKSDDL